MNHDIFISYSREDKEIVLPLIDKINKEVGTQCWIDLEGIESGEQFETKIIQAIDSAQIVLFVLSDNSLKSDWTKREVYYAEQKKKKIIPVVIDGKGLRDWFMFHFQNVDYIEAKSDEQSKKLVRDLRKRLNREEIPDKGEEIKKKSKLKLLWMVLGVIIVASVLFAAFYKPKATIEMGAGFSVSPTNKVVFSKGNLQYQASTNTWQFAENQWDIIGKGNTKISPDYDGWIDLLGWGTGETPTDTSTKSTKYQPFKEWGNNIIINGGDKHWRTLTNSEWEYVFNGRKTNIKYAKAIVNGVNGVILLPDNWNEKEYKLNMTNDDDADYNENSISQSDWTKMFEANGAAFLPATGYREGTKVNNEGEIGYYWSQTPFDNAKAYYVFIEDCNLTPSYHAYGRADGRGVRLVCDVEK